MKACVPIDFTPEELIILVKLVWFINAESKILVTLEGIVIVVNPFPCYPILVIPAPIETLVKAPHPPNVAIMLSPMVKFWIWPLI